MRVRQLLALALCSSLCSLMIMASASVPPTVAISSLASLDQGTLVRIVGILADAARYDSGTEGLVVVDDSSGSIARVMCSPGVQSQPSRYASIGDELAILGETGKPGRPPILFTTSDEVSLLRKSELVLTLEILSDNWQVFIGDTLSIRGILILGLSGYRLASADGEMSVAISSDSEVLPDLVGSGIVVSARMSLDSRDMSLVLVVASVSLAA